MSYSAIFVFNMDLTQKLINWYSEHKRDLPWRNTRDPYRIWLSEVILQQTRVNQGLEYYYRFLNAFPRVHDLAKASEEQVLKLWQGLGYYSRARNLHATAKAIVERNGGVFPVSTKELLKLKGIGEYTAAAIASIAFGLPVPVVDGNVSRVLSRLFLIAEPVDSSKGKKILSELSYQLIDTRNPGTSNQAFMELGALICKPSSPLCSDCPVKVHCLALRENAAEKFPVKKEKAAIADLYIYYLVHKSVVHGKHKVLMHHRKNNGIWKNLYDFPSVESTVLLQPETAVKALSSLVGIKPGDLYVHAITGEYLHKLSHRTLHAFFIESVGNSTKKAIRNYIVADFQELENFPVPRLIERYLLTSRHMLPCGI